MNKDVEVILQENERRLAELRKVFNPATGEGSVGERVRIDIADYFIPTQYVPKEYASEKLVKDVIKAKGIGNYLHKTIGEYGAEDVEVLNRVLIKLRCKHDFPFWAYMFVKIKDKKGGDDIKFKLNRPQRRLVETMEQKRKARKPINIILLKARQWGGSTVIQIYMAWIQLIHKKNWNSTIASHVNTVSATVRGMFSKLMDAYPDWMLFPIGTDIPNKLEKMTSFEGQQGIQYIPTRGCKIRIATANAQENLRSEDVAMVHATEVALWPDTKLLHPEDFVDACMSGMGRGYLNMKVLESTAKGSGNYFHREWVDAKAKKSDYEPVFISWREIEHDSTPFDSDDEREQFAEWLWDNRLQKEISDRRSEPGAYLWKQWELGATLEGLHWYVDERKSKQSHDHMASEAPSDDIEAFSATGEALFDEEKVERLRKTCRPPKMIGEVQSEYSTNDRSIDRYKRVLQGIHFVEDKSGELSVWSEPEVYPDERIEHRYLVVVDIGGTHHAADWSVILVLDRYWMMDGGKPSVVAQWYGHIDHDLLAWKSAQIAKWYDNALLVIESNTLDKERDVNADISEFILNRVKQVYDNMYERKAKEDDVKDGITNRYGWHTNRDTKPKIIKGLQECVRDMLYTERDERCLNEMLTYEHNGQKYEAKQGYHDDLLMTRAIGLWVCYNEMELPRIAVERQVSVDLSTASNALL